MTRITSVFVQPVIQTLTNSSVLKSGHTVIETDKFNAMSLPLSLSGVMSMILVVLSMIIMLWLYIASNLNQVLTHYGHVIVPTNSFLVLSYKSGILWMLINSQLLKKALCDCLCLHASSK